MKRILKSIVFAALVCLSAHEAKAQSYQLQIDSIVGIPDTVFNGQEITFYMIVSVNSPLFYQGDIFVELEYNGGFYPVDTTIVANASLSPNAPNTLQAMHRLSTDDDLNIGDNVVVVWPRIGDGVSPPQEVVNPETVIITVVEPNGINSPESTRIFESFVSPNPAITNVQFNFKRSETIIQSTLFDVAGRVVLTSDTQTNLDISHLPRGVYFVDVLTEKGNVYSDKLLISR